MSPRSIEPANANGLAYAIWHIIRNGEDKPFIRDAAEKLGVSYSSLGNFLRGNVTRTEWLSDQNLSERLAGNFPLGWAHYQDTYKTAFQKHIEDGKPETAPLTVSEQWKLTVRDLFTNAAALHNESVWAFRTRISQQTLRNAWDRTMDGNPDVPVSVYKKSLHTVMRLCAPEKFPDAPRMKIAIDLCKAAEQLHAMMPEFK